MQSRDPQSILHSAEIAKLTGFEAEPGMAEGIQHHTHAQLPDLSQVHVLLADADEPLLDYYEQALVECGATVAKVASGVECVKQSHTFRPQVLVLEPELPWGGGSGVLTRMLEDSDLPTTPVIVVTAGRDLNELRRILKFPLYDLVVKPVPARQLASKIRWVVDYAPRLGDVGWPRS